MKNPTSSMMSGDPVPCIVQIFADKKVTEMSSHNGLLDDKVDITERLAQAAKGPKRCGLAADAWSIAVQLLLLSAKGKIERHRSLSDPK